MSQSVLKNFLLWAYIFGVLAVSVILSSKSKAKSTGEMKLESLHQSRVEFQKQPTQVNMETQVLMLR